VASRAASVRPAPVLVPPTRVGLPSRDTESVASRSEDDAHGSKDRAKDAFCRAHATISRACAGACASKRMRTTFPSSATSGHPLSLARPTSRGDAREVNGPTEARLPTSPREEWRLSQDQDAFHRHDTRRSHAEGGIPPAFAPALSLTPPSTGIASVTVRSPACP